MKIPRSILIEIDCEKKIDLIDNRYKKIDNRKIDFYVINYFYNFFLFLTGECNFTPYKKNGTGGCQLVPRLNGKKKASNRSGSKLNFVQKSPRTHMIDMVVIQYRNCKLHSFRAQCCQKYALFQKKHQMKVVQN